MTTTTIVNTFGSCGCNCFDVVQRVNRLMLEVMNIFNCFVCLEVPAGVTEILKAALWWRS
jgi:hypothetical protein